MGEISAVPIMHIAIDRDALDIDGQWAALSETGREGALLVRPDQHVAWRVTDLPENPAASLKAALERISRELKRGFESRR